MSNAYGKTALSARLKLPDFSKYLDKIDATGNSIDDAAVAAIDAALPIVEKSMKDGAARHRKGAGKYGTDAVYDAIEKTPAHMEGNLAIGSVGIDTQKHPEAVDGVYQEYGDGHSPQFPDPFVRPAIDDNRKEIVSAMRGVLKSKGVPAG